MHLPMRISALNLPFSWSNLTPKASFTASSWSEIFPLLGAIALALAFTALLALLVEDAEDPTTNARQQASGNHNKRLNKPAALPRFVGLAEKAEWSATDGSIQVAVGGFDEENMEKEAGDGLLSLMGRYGHRATRPRDIRRPRQPLLLPKRLLVTPPTTQYVVHQSPPASPTSPISASEIEEGHASGSTTPPGSPPVSFEDQISDDPGSPPWTPLSAPPTPMISMAKMIMHRHDQANKRARRARAANSPPPSPPISPPAVSPTSSSRIRSL